MPGVLRRTARSVAAILLLSTPGFAVADDPRTLEWDDLIPESFSFDDLFEETDLDVDIDTLDDNDPRAIEAMEAVREQLDAAPVVDTLDGQRVRLPGFVVPLEGNRNEVSEFLLVPYFGACIHVPPPPANQIVYVTTGEEPASIRGTFDTVWVTGTMHTERTRQEKGTAGYTIRAEDVAPYD